MCLGNEEWFMENCEYGMEKGECCIGSEVGHMKNKEWCSKNEEWCMNNDGGCMGKEE